MRGWSYFYYASRPSWGKVRPCDICRRVVILPWREEESPIVPRAAGMTGDL